MNKKRSHICEKSRSCSCDTQGLEPDETCPVHGWFSPENYKCIHCGRFMPWKMERESKMLKEYDGSITYQLGLGIMKS